MGQKPLKKPKPPKKGQKTPKKAKKGGFWGGVVGGVSKGLIKGSIFPWMGYPQQIGKSGGEGGVKKGGFWVFLSVFWGFGDFGQKGQKWGILGGLKRGGYFGGKKGGYFGGGSGGGPAQ